MLKYPKHIKYRQISDERLYDNLQRKCEQFGGNIKSTFEKMEHLLQIIGFEKSNDSNWYYGNKDVKLSSLWICHRQWIEKQIIYKTIIGIPKTVCLLSNGKWRDYEILFDYQHRAIMLLDEKKLKIKLLQVGNPNKSSLEFNVHIQYYNDIDIYQTHAKWACLILNHTWHFRTTTSLERDYLSDCLSIIWNDEYNQIHKDPFNPFSISLKQGCQYFKDKLQKREHFVHGADELIEFKCIEPHTNNEDALLHHIYKHLPCYPTVQVHWTIMGYFVVPYTHTVSIERTHIPKRSIHIDSTAIPLNEKCMFNPLLYECDVQKLRVMQDALHFKLRLDNQLHRLLRELIKNGYLADLTSEKPAISSAEIKEQIHYNEKDENSKLVFNDQILTILKDIKKLYHDDIHKQMGYPLQLWNICAILLYCGKSCNVQFSYDQIKFRHHIWPFMDYYLQEAIMILHRHERREESEMELYCGLKGVRLKNIKEIKSGSFISHVSTSDDIQVAQRFRSNQGCILHFHPSMRRARGILSCDVSWISPFKYEREILFARSYLSLMNDEKTHKELVHGMQK
ncbi:hypothetical protein RFI_05897 [Reticulomyxa filosa]|uniref:Uncharacterized protein n=1 Tax=Reticulomyxa filosa TaxID=46433 RepID=X6NZF7_RETFI|nr:hypothetical protein RFI_05897 [Reticulomyxa filosa]|eukprot:ETO31224.1 hypothetical protein RFI_05897 [Reticulomyxa filosa]